MAMAAFNSLPALSSSGATPGGGGSADPLGGLTASSGPSLGLDAFDPDIAFDESLLVNGGLSTLPFTPTQYDFETFSTTFEDPFSYPTRHYDGAGAVDAEIFNDDAASPQELDNKLLGFSALIPGAAALVDEAGQFAEPNMTAELYGMFFVAEDVFGGENTGRPLELTCYRRNLWQCSGQITLPRHIAHCVDDQGRQMPVVDLAASITAIESIEGKSTEIISIPWKSSNPPLGGATGAEDTKVASSPPNVPVDLSSGQELDGSRVTVPVSWKRLQFKHATANNGRRKGLQQHYVVQINLLAKTKSSEYIKIAEVQSGPVIVRGRSPRNFDSRKDVPLTGDKKLDRRTTDPPFQPQERGDLAQNLQRYHSLGNIQSGDWSTPQSFATPNVHPSKKVAVSPGLTRPPVPTWGSDTTSSRGNSKFAGLSSPQSQLMSKQTSHGAAGGPTLPINLSLSEDERSPNRSGSESTQSPQFAKSIASVSASGPAGQNHPNGSPLETADMLYEYFPLSLDDWMPPVDAIYRPHVVHHTIVPPEVKAQQIKSKTKRYFAAE
ncbi:hypothetical protein B0T26DRAFT_742988 [Lasiosphaeria miniovina]|uniref:NDT80 domain-containing protein n=1 Tax=Lasiosphaeria miniovina TaxID=1954250 RepID=A0AA40DQD0_9PEZI|nr:uncharacterized protein B0T26DRAFT_742988 [Lasiosphaeria miniovina]KAK0709596.1 hypothetical protein B0T26DRAFT_742988 [Lasiosphaeria miniovina]